MHVDAVGVDVDERAADDVPEGAMARDLAHGGTVDDGHGSVSLS